MAKKAVTETRTPLIENGVVKVDPLRFPILHRCMTLLLERSRGPWAKVVELRASGQMDAADRAARRAMGVKTEPMSEETKEKLRAYNEEHKDEIKERRDQERIVRQRTRAIMAAPKRMRRAK
jgi:hypothetical protein